MKRKVLVFGNPLLKGDSIALELGKELEKKGFEVREVQEPRELDEVEDWGKVVILDAVQGLKEVRVFDSLKGFDFLNRTSMHDFDFGLYLGLKEKLGELKGLKIIGVPVEWKKKKALGEVEKALEKL